MLAECPRLIGAIDRIYDAVLEPSAWMGILSDIVDRTGGTQAILLRSDIVTGQGDVFLSRYNDENAWTLFQSYYAAINPLHNVADPTGYAAGWRPIMLRDEDWMSREDVEATEYYNDFLCPIEANHGLYVRLALEGRVLTTISVGRGKAHGRFDEEAMAAIAPLHGHLIRAATLSRRFAQVRQFANGAVAAMDAASDPLMLLDDAGRVVHANDAGERLLASGAIVRGTAGRLSLTARHGAGQIDTALARATDAECRQASCFPLVDIDGGPAADVSVLPIASDAGIEAAGGPAVLIRISPPSADQRIDRLIERYGLTAAERSLALSLAQGGNLRDTAEARGVSVNTTRRHLASIFDKTGVHRQADLVRLLTRAE
ncbi:helix-turn-helix transcriptional regulator [Sphingomonas bacterium]|uniref:helix-turn-helix transcriptional regulator n=1 Tax=Sphingomonas bacterium TaxID=1895847 RepID=UPI0015760891|nr:helix-turn-helix transcriptional regulator [Sphingomonas bacterium]